MNSQPDAGSIIVKRWTSASIATICLVLAAQVVLAFGPLFISANIIDDETRLLAFLDSFAKVPGKKILVHGGGKLATKVAEGLGIQQQLVDGRRITDAETLKIVTMVYAGTINKNIVAQLHEIAAVLVGYDGGHRVVAAQRASVGQKMGRGHDAGYIKLSCG